MTFTYTAEQDPLCYPGTDVLINRADLRNPYELAQFELEMTLTRADEPLPDGDLDYDHYKAIHQYLFQDVYDWAGQPRSIRIGKGGNWFCYPEYIDREMARIFRDLEEADQLTGLPREDFARQAAHVLAEINAVHPFREGNGRTQLSFLVLLAENASHVMNFDKLDPEGFLEAMITSFAGDEASLAEMIVAMLD